METVACPECDLLQRLPALPLDLIFEGTGRSRQDDFEADVGPVNSDVLDHSQGYEVPLDLRILDRGQGLEDNLLRDHL